jgi:hypothetical protein
MEHWKPVVGYEGIYEVSDIGRVWSVKTKKPKKPTVLKSDPRPFVLLWQFNKPKMVRIHTLVLTAFVGPRPYKQQGCHNDGNPQNCVLSNLRWDTATANQADRIKHGTTNRGERCGNAKLTLEQVNAIRADTRMQKDIAKDYGVRASQISRIKTGARWAYD